MEYSETAIVDDISVSTTIKTIDVIFFNSNGSPTYLSYYDELDTTQKSVLNYSLEYRNIRFRARNLQRKRGHKRKEARYTEESFGKYQFEETNAKDNEILSRSIFLSNAFAVSDLLSVFQ